MFSYETGSDLSGRFQAYGLPLAFSTALEREIRKWEANSGPAWTVKRLKSLKKDFIRLHAGLDPLTWVRKNRNGDWYGVWGSLKRYASRSLRTFERVLNCLMVYSSFIPSEPTEEHLAKMRASIGANPAFVPEQLLADLAQHARKVVGERQLGPTQPLLTFQGRQATKAPVWGERSTSQSENLEGEIGWIRDPYHKVFLNRHWECYSPVLEGIHTAASMMPLPGLSAGAFHIDQLGPFETIQARLKPPFVPTDAGSLVPLTKDGGWKVRWIASPFRLHQLALRPLGSALFGLLRELPWDCTYDQTKSYEYVQNHLRLGKEAFAVDLTSATDYFPLGLQEAVLKAIFPLGKHQVDLFRELSRSDWSAGKFGTFRWTKGQPMGLYPSFASFALTHGLLLDYLSGSVPGRFFILGDDVVILHRPTYEAYLKVLDLLECPCDLTKSLVSNKVTEFAGKIITPERIISAFKWRDVSSRNFMDLMRTFGQRFRKMLRPRERAVYDCLASLLPPHGCNHSTGMAKPLEQVVEETDLFEKSLPEAREGRVHTSFLHRLVQLLKPGQPNSLYTWVDWDWFQAEAARLDESQRTAFERTPFKGMPGDRGVLADVLEDRWRAELPTVVNPVRVDHSDLLCYYEKVLGLQKSKNRS